MRLEQLFNDRKVLGNQLRILRRQDRVHVFEPVYQAVQLATHSPRRLQVALQLPDLLFGQVLHVSPTRVDRRLPVTQSAACVRVCSAKDVGTQSLTMFQRLLLGGQLVVELLQQVSKYISKWGD